MRYLFLLLAFSGCSKGFASIYMRPSLYSMKCEEVEGDWTVMRCENKETVCYIVRSTYPSISCLGPCKSDVACMARK